MIIINKIARQNFSKVYALAKYLQPINLQLKEATQLPLLRLKSEKYLLQNWWSQKPFDLPENIAMNVPVFSFVTGQYTNKQIQLPQDIFNYPLRRDLIHRLYDFRIRLNKFTTKQTRNRAMTVGSGIKMRKQKGMGVARMGDKRAPHLFKGGKVHGAKPKIYSFHLNAKIKINALKALFSAKLTEGKIKIVESQTLVEGKTKYIDSAFKAHINDTRGIMCIITGQNCDENFERAQRNHPRVLWHDAYTLDVFSLFKADKILITQKGLEQLIQNIYKTIYVTYRHPYMPKIEQNQKDKQEQVLFDPSKPYEFKFKILAQYMEQYQKLMKEKPSLIERQKFKTRRIEYIQ